MDVALGMSMAASPVSSISMVLSEGEGADGVTVEQEVFDVPAGESMSEQVVVAITAARAGAAQAGHRLTSIGVAFRDPVEADLLRDALVRHRVDGVMVVSAFLAAVALTQAAGSSVGHTSTALLFAEPGAVTLATVDAGDGAITDVHRHRLGDADLVDEAAELVSAMADVPVPPDGVFVVGDGVEVAPVKSRLEAVTSLAVSAPGEPSLALARGAALASANAPLFASSTQAMAWAQDLGTGSVDPAALGGYDRVQAALLAPVGVDYNATSDNAALAYSALTGGLDADYLANPPSEGLTERVDSARLDFRVDENNPRGRLGVLVGSAAAVVVTAISALVVSMVVGIGSTRSPQIPQPRPGSHVVPSQQAPPPKPAVPAPPPKPEAPAPVPAPQAPVPEAPVVNVPAPLPAAPAPPPPAAPPPPQIPVIIPIPIPGVPDIGGPPGKNRGGDDRWGPKRGGDRDDDDRGWSPKLPFLPGGDGHGRGKFKIPGL